MTFDIFLDKILSFAFWNSIFNTIRWLFILIDFLLLLGFIYVFRRAKEFYPPFVSHSRIPYLKGTTIPKRSAGEVSMRREWNDFLSRAAVASDETLPLLVIEADKIVDSALKKLGFPGDTMLERIQALARSRKMKTLEAFWRAHKTRNEIAHAPNFLISRAEAERHLSSYQKFLKELGCL